VTELERRARISQALRESGATRGARNGRAKLDDAGVAKVRELLAQGVEGKTVAKRMSISPAAVSMIKRGWRWK
jgi:hypothetical protein